MSCFLTSFKLHEMTVEHLSKQTQVVYYGPCRCAEIKRVRGGRKGGWGGCCWGVWRKESETKTKTDIERREQRRGGRGREKRGDGREWGLPVPAGGGWRW